ncbi:uncharacterized protein DUF397 [Herbihabitans rhizosphaerae]|uniref:Uncharacterized protein DUF397 n=1 Tax=Herbihabitans rhizosphaerae TaxID=1872711 RepID=A0A4Q7KM09_9PSEU|nr:DUF397 domain-containing protein [Herbihabitans rhizosphaerae]RZS37699.1 uncharacterized protein DUF397 [Herbihabitans rhizosphaerae]
MTLNWRKSSHSGGVGGNGNGGDCIEVAYGPTGPLMRDSKNPNGPILSVADLVASLRALRQ